MLNYLFLRIPVWAWMCILAFIVYNCCQTCNIYKNNQNTLTEKFASDAKITIYNFNTSWCGWSKRFQPEWDKFTNLCKDMHNVEAIDVKCDNDENNGLCANFQVPGYPTVIAIVNNKQIVYENERNANKLIEFVKSL